MCKYLLFLLVMTEPATQRGVYQNKPSSLPCCQVIIFLNSTKQECVKYNGSDIIIKLDPGWSPKELSLFRAMC